MADEYEGRLECDGYGNLLASDVRAVGSTTVAVHDANGDPVIDANGDQVTVMVPLMRYGKHHGRPVAHDKDKDVFVFLEPGEESHNERHHQQNIELVGTQDVDPELPGYAGTKTKPNKGHEHHFGVLEDDLHYEEGAELNGVVTNTRVRQEADNTAALSASHTHQHKVGGR